MLKPQNIRANHEVDEIDRSILSILGKNGRISNADLANQVGIAALRPALVEFAIWFSAR